jgi:hypothetical protein
MHITFEFFILWHFQILIYLSILSSICDCYFCILCSYFSNFTNFTFYILVFSVSISMFDYLLFAALISSHFLHVR